MANATTIEAPAKATDSKKLFEMLAAQVNEYIQTPLDEAKVHEIVDQKLDAKLDLVSRIDVTVNEKDPVRIEGAHAQFAIVMKVIQRGRRNVLMVGPAGSGKTTLAKDVAKALSLPFGFISLSAGVTESHLLGRVMPQSDGSWKYEPSLFVKLYTTGGVFLLDEIDAADANVMVSVNAALANGVMALPNGEIAQRHKDCYIIAAANTFGRGANAMYVGRNALDAATLDRFVLATVQVDYDRKLEARIAGQFAIVLLEWVEAVRKVVVDNRMRRVISTRLVEGATQALAAKETLDAIKAEFFSDWTQDELVKVGALAQPAAKTK